jgi:hypothetical protein
MKFYENIILITVYVHFIKYIVYVQNQKHGVRKTKVQDNILIFNFYYLMQNMLVKVDTSVKDKTPR